MARLSGDSSSLGRIGFLIFDMLREGITVFALAKGEEIGEHAAPGDAMVLILDGEAEIKIDGKLSIVKKGECIVMPRDIPHALRAAVSFKMLLTVINEV